jgi:hypothetical protein
MNEWICRYDEIFEGSYNDLLVSVDGATIYVAMLYEDGEIWLGASRTGSIDEGEEIVFGYELEYWMRCTGPCGCAYLR